MIMRPAKNPSSCRIPFSTVGTEVRAWLGGAELHRGNSVEAAIASARPLGLLRQLLRCARDNGGPLAPAGPGGHHAAAANEVPSCGMIRCDMASVH